VLKMVWGFQIMVGLRQMKVNTRILSKNDRFEALGRIPRVIRFARDSSWIPPLNFFLGSVCRGHMKKAKYTNILTSDCNTVGSRSVSPGLPIPTKYYKRNMSTLSPPDMLHQTNPPTAMRPTSLTDNQELTISSTINPFG